MVNDRAMRAPAEEAVVVAAARRKATSTAATPPPGVQDRLHYGPVVESLETRQGRTGGGSAVQSPRHAVRGGAAAGGAGAAPWN